MRRIKTVVICALIVVLAVGVAVPATAAVTRKQITAEYPGIRLYVNGELITPKDPNGNTVDPFASEGTTYLPLRALANAFGYNVYYDAQEVAVYMTGPGSSPTTPTPVPTPQPTPAPTPEPTPEPFDWIWQSNLETRITKCIKAEQANLQAYNNAINEAIARGMGRSSYVQGYYDKKAASEEYITLMQEVLYDIQIATTNAELAELEELVKICE